jgi:hypothetical protein
MTNARSAIHRRIRADRIVWPRLLALATLLSSSIALAADKGEIQYLGQGRYTCTGSTSFACRAFNAREAQRQDAIRREQRRDEALRYEMRRRDMERYIERLERGGADGRYDVYRFDDASAGDD